MTIFYGTAEFRGKYFFMGWEKTCSEKNGLGLSAVRFFQQIYDNRKFAEKMMG